jgi:peptidyl-prolyl cis-trans isomerase A (cyclophilin A)
LALNTPVLARRMALAFSCSLLLAGASAFAQSQSPAAAAPRVKLATSAGDIVVELAPDKAPKTVQNFLTYVKDKHYDGTVFHRVIDGFMIQGGGYTADLTQKPTRDAIPLEAGNGLKNDTYTIAMARTGNPNSATSQFFINVKNNDMLNAPNPDGYGYTVFGKVVAGQDVVDKIRAVPTANKGGMQNVPLSPVIIQSATVVAK